jgi:hypothetical protein
VTRRAVYRAGQGGDMAKTCVHSDVSSAERERIRYWAGWLVDLLSLYGYS